MPAAPSLSGELIIEPARTPDGGPLSPVYWTATDGSIEGPAVPESFARRDGRDWVIVNFQGETQWIDADTLRSKKDFEAQQEHTEVEEHAKALQPGWRVTFRDQEGRLVGGLEDAPHCTVRECLAGEVLLTNGERLPLSAIVGVNAIAPDGRWLGGWEVRKHGYDGEGPLKPGGIHQ